MRSLFLQRILWRSLRAVGYKQFSWDSQFRAGLWCHLKKCPHTISLSASLCRGGRLVEFGCGEATLPHVLPSDCFSEYLGFDISEVAIQRARQRAVAANLANCHFEKCDMADWKGTAAVSLIVVEECLYYLTPVDTEAFIRRCFQSLLPSGKLLVIVHDASKHARTLDICRRLCKVIDESAIESRVYLTLATRVE